MLIKWNSVGLHIGFFFLLTVFVGFHIYIKTVNFYQLLSVF